MRRLLFPLFCSFCLLIAGCGPELPLRVACVGDSITQGAGISEPSINAYPAQLGAILGEDYMVQNFGHGGRTLLHEGDYPYVEEETYQNALNFDPNIVIIKLGTNDSKPYNWVHKEDFVENYLQMIKAFRDKGADRILVCLPVPVYETNFDITEAIVKGEVIPLVREVIHESGAEMVDLYAALSAHPEWFPDGVHPNQEGAGEMARVLAEAILAD